MFALCSETAPSLEGSCLALPELLDIPVFLELLLDPLREIPLFVEREMPPSLLLREGVLFTVRDEELDLEGKVVTLLLPVVEFRTLLLSLSDLVTVCELPELDLEVE